VEETLKTQQALPGEDNRRQQNQKEETMHCFSVRPEQFTGLSPSNVLYTCSLRGVGQLLHY